MEGLMRFLSLLAPVLLTFQQLSFCGEKQVTPLQENTAKEWISSLALQAATWGAPIVTMYCLRHHDALGPHAKAPPNTIWRMENISTPELSKQAGYVTP